MPNERHNLAVAGYNYDTDVVGDKPALQGGQCLHRQVFQLCRGRILKQQLLGGCAENVGEQGFILREYLVKDADDLSLEVGDRIDQVTAEA